MNVFWLEFCCSELQSEYVQCFCFPPCDATPLFSCDLIGSQLQSTTGQSLPEPGEVKPGLTSVLMKPSTTGSVCFVEASIVKASTRRLRRPIGAQHSRCLQVERRGGSLSSAYVTLMTFSGSVAPWQPIRRLFWFLEPNGSIS